MRQVAGRKERKWRHFLMSPFVLKPGEPPTPTPPQPPPTLVRPATPTMGDQSSGCSARIRRLSGRRVQKSGSPPRAFDSWQDVSRLNAERQISLWACERWSKKKKKANSIFWAEKLSEDVMSDKGNRSGSKPLRPLIVSGKELKILNLNLEKYS